ncbi:NYN domain-containing protein [Rhizobium panacihumi]|uniref:NYN domain-containing protein n=1 Tax=Rhizobium panacihumi TaxID=2008450 RepID=UPI003D7BEA7F
MHETRSRRLAVLIDAENASAKIADGLFKEIAKLGDATVRRIYGDFSTGQCRPWTDVLARHAIIPQQVFAYTTGKNACDIALAIDAMDILHTGRLDGFCLVSSDSDFTRLATRIRENGLDVFGFGEKKTPESFRLACQRFIYTEGLLSPAMADHVVVPLNANVKKSPKMATLLIKQAVAKLENEDGWVHLGPVGAQLSKLASAFKPQNYGAKKLSDLVRQTNAFDLQVVEGNMLRIRPKQPLPQKNIA